MNLKKGKKNVCFELDLREEGEEKKTRQQAKPRVWDMAFLQGPSGELGFSMHSKDSGPLLNLDFLVCFAL